MAKEDAPLLRVERREGGVTIRSAGRNVSGWWVLGACAVAGAATCQLAADGGIARGVGIALTTVGVLVSTLLAIGTSGERETRGVLTRVRRLDIERTAGSGYRASPEDATLKADRRQWKLRDVRSVVHGHADSFHSVYVVLPSEVLWVVFSDRPDAVRDSAILVAQELGHELQQREHPSWQAQSWAPVVLVFGCMSMALASLWQLVESFGGHALAPPGVVAAVAVFAPVVYAFVVTRFTRPKIQTVAKRFVQDHLA